MAKLGKAELKTLLVVLEGSNAHQILRQRPGNDAPEALAFDLQLLASAMDKIEAMVGDRDREAAMRNRRRPGLAPADPQLDLPLEATPPP